MGVGMIQNSGLSHVTTTKQEGSNINLLEYIIVILWSWRYEAVETLPKYNNAQL